VAGGRGARADEVRGQGVVGKRRERRVRGVNGAERGCLVQPWRGGRGAELAE